MSYVPALRSYYRVARGAVGLHLEASRTARSERDWTDLGPLRFADVTPDACAAALVPHTALAPDDIVMSLLVVGYNGYVTAYDAPYNDLLDARRVVWSHPRTLTGPQSGACGTADIAWTPDGWLLICGHIRVLLDVETHEALESWLEREDRSA